MKLLSAFALLSTLWVVTALPASTSERTNPTNITASPDQEQAVVCNCEGSYISYHDVSVLFKLSTQVSISTTMTLTTRSTRRVTLVAAGKRLLSHYSARVRSLTDEAFDSTYPHTFNNYEVGVR